MGVFIHKEKRQKKGRKDKIEDIKSFSTTALLRSSRCYVVISEAIISHNSPADRSVVI